MAPAVIRGNVYVSVGASHQGARWWSSRTVVVGSEKMKSMQSSLGEQRQIIGLPGGRHPCGIFSRRCCRLSSVE